MHLHHQLHHRLDISGPLVLHTGLHIGAGDREGTDASILRSLDGQPYIPGSSIKGVVRARVESMAHLLGHPCCALVKDETDAQTCLSSKKDGSNQIHEAVKQAAGSTQKDKLLSAFLKDKLCICCRLFGGASWRARLNFDDLHPEDERDLPVERRDGVGIDRDSRRAVNNVKYGFQVVPAQSRFRFRLTAENLDRQERGLVIMALHELVNGHVGLGGKLSRGLGACSLDGEQTQVQETDFSDRAQVLAHFSATKAQTVSLESWLESQGDTWLMMEADHA